jgi:hypothetical protein
MERVVKNAALATVIWSKDRIGGHLTAASDLTLMDLHRGTFTIYVMVPEDAPSVYAPFLRVMMGCAIIAMVRGKHLPRPRYKPAAAPGRVRRAVLRLWRRASVVCASTPAPCWCSRTSAS